MFEDCFQSNPVPINVQLPNNPYEENLTSPFNHLYTDDGQSDNKMKAQLSPAVAISAQSK